ncbi:hypothetical protein V9T40_006732 [Parthenolecanium corni]|uniref:Uncharacterized protein n=1 Tax=Parthenolecanium corni TaxID=536013 RepID=A0AAN9TRH4_9HEMI
MSFGDTDVTSQRGGAKTPTKNEYVGRRREVRGHRHIHQKARTQLKGPTMRTRCHTETGQNLACPPNGESRQHWALVGGLEKVKKKKKKLKEKDAETDGHRKREKGAQKKKEMAKEKLALRKDDEREKE